MNFKSRSGIKGSLKPESGTYIIVLKVKTSQKIEIGKIGQFTFEKGYYFYIGSAHGPGGIRARIERHLRKDKASHWHIDYLSSAVPITAVIICYSKKKKECIWASKLISSSSLSTPVNGFGSSDCSCQSHLFFSKLNYNIDIFIELLKDFIEFIDISS
jgi:Uri superfamily endonuclease